MFDGLAGAITGFLLGFVIQRGRFDMAAGLHAYHFRREYEPLKACVLAVLTAAATLFVLVRMGQLTTPQTPYYWLAATVGGLLFGAGMALTGGGAGAVWSRSGQGAMDSLMTLMGFVVGTGMAASGVASGAVNTLMAARVDRVANLYDLLDVSFGTAVAFSVVLALWWFSLAYKRTCSCQPTPGNWWDRDNLFPGLKDEKLDAILLYRLVFLRRWSWVATGVAVGLVAAFSGRLEVTVGTREFLHFMVGGGPVKPFGVLLVLGIAGGAAVAAWVAGEQKLTGSGPQRLLLSLAGGVVMGLGAVTAMGDDIASGLVGTALFTLNGMTATLAMIAGAWAVHVGFSLLDVIRIPGDEKCQR